MLRQGLAIFFLVFFLFLSAPAVAASISGKVIGVTDGDTITVLGSNKIAYEIRLANIDAPETTCHLRRPGKTNTACVDHGQPFAKAAKRAAMSMLYGQIVTVQLVETRGQAAESYSRLIGTVYLRGVDANYELVKQGWAWHEKHYGSQQQDIKTFTAYSAAETAARRGRLGLWLDNRKPVPPWEWRREHAVRSR